jgi:Superinfection immunity protein
MQGPDTAASVGGAIIAIVLLGVAIALYFLPAIIASRRGHQNVDGIAVLNLLLGWTLLGWIAALIWACTSVHELFDAKCPYCLSAIPASATRCSHCTASVPAR